MANLTNFELILQPIPLPSSVIFYEYEIGLSLGFLLRIFTSCTDKIYLIITEQIAR